MTVDPSKVATTCRLVKGEPAPGRFLRTVVRTDLTRITFPASLPCPSGWRSDNGTCVRSDTNQQLTWYMNAQGRCDAATVASVKSSVEAFLSNPNTAYGVLTPSLEVEVGCIEVGAAQQHNGCGRQQSPLVICCSA
jgi:hypothetical protein